MWGSSWSSHSRFRYSIHSAFQRSTSRAVHSSGGEASSYDDMTKAELYERAKKVGIAGRSNMSKEQLRKALRNH